MTLPCYCHAIDMLWRRRRRRSTAIAHDSKAWVIAGHHSVDNIYEDDGKPWEWPLLKVPI